MNEDQTSNKPVKKKLKSLRKRLESVESQLMALRFKNEVERRAGLAERTICPDSCKCAPLHRRRRPQYAPTSDDADEMPAWAGIKAQSNALIRAGVRPDQVLAAVKDGLTVPMFYDQDAPDEGTDRSRTRHVDGGDAVTDPDCTGMREGWATVSEHLGMTRGTGDRGEINQDKIWRGPLPWFAVSELACKGTGDMTLNASFAARLITLRSIWNKPLRVNSCCRSKEHNDRVGGSPGSFHVMDGNTRGVIGCSAIDIGWRDYSTAEKLEFARLAWYLGFSVGLSQGFIHLDLRSELTNLLQIVFRYNNSVLAGITDVQIKNNNPVMRTPSPLS